MAQKNLCILFFLLLFSAAGLNAHEKKIVKIGVHHNPPLCSIDSANNARGIFIDIIDKVASLNNWHIEYSPTSIAAGFQELQYGKIDLLTTVARTKEREEIVLFNEETIFTNWGIIYSNRNTNIEAITDLDGKTIALERGDIHAKALLKLLNDFHLNCNITWCDNNDEVFKKIASYEAQAGAVNKIYGYQHNINQKHKATSIIFNPVNVHIAGGPLSASLLHQFDTTLAQIKTSQPEFYQETINQWLINKPRSIEKWVIYLIYILLGLILILGIILLSQRRLVRLKSNRLKEARKLGEQRAKTIRQIEREQTLILNSLDEQVIFMDNEYNLVWANDAFKRANTIPFDKVIGKKCYEIYFERNSPCDFCQYETCQKTNRTEVREHINPKTGKVYIHKTHPVFDAEQRPIGFVEILSDISDKKKYEEELIAAKLKAEQSDYLKSAFLANMSHEIRTPMNAIIGFSELLEDETLNQEEKRTYLNIIQSNGNQLLKLISDILIFSQIESGHVTLQYGTINIIDFLNDIYKQFESELSKSGKPIKIELDTAIGKSEELQTDSVRFKQIVFNLLTNAIKFTEIGTITIGAYLENNSLVLYVKDTGIGIPESKHKDVFKRFSQVENNQMRKASGSGLGLTIANDLIKQLGGKIHLKSEPGKGSTFFITHPLSPYTLAKGTAVLQAQY